MTGPLFSRLPTGVGSSLVVGQHSSRRIVPDQRTRIQETSTSEFGVRAEAELRRAGVWIGRRGTRAQIRKSPLDRLSRAFVFARSPQWHCEPALQPGL